jgi:hypothetical protein
VRPDTFIIISEKQDKKPWELKLSDSKSYVELGPFLSHNDKVEARKALKVAGLTEMNEQWWRPLSK